MNKIGLRFYAVATSALVGAILVFFILVLPKGKASDRQEDGVDIVSRHGEKFNATHINLHRKKIDTNMAHYLRAN